MVFMVMVKMVITITIIMVIMVIVTIPWRAKSRFRGVQRVCRVHFGYN